MENKKQNPLNAPKRLRIRRDTTKQTETDIPKTDNKSENDKSK